MRGAGTSIHAKDESPVGKIIEDAMRELVEQIEQLSSVILSADSADLTGLADAHTRLEKLSQAISELPAESASALAQASNISLTARKKIEKLILNEAKDADAELKNITLSIGDLQHIVEAALSGVAPTATSAEAAPVTAEATAQPETPSHTAIQTGPVQLNPDDLPLIGEFVTEATGHLEQAEQDLLKLEEDTGDTETISSLFRSFHTIKGVAGFLNLNVIQALAHAAENLLDKAREGSIRITGRASELVLESIDKMKALVAGLDAAAKSGNSFIPIGGVNGLVERLSEFVVAAQNDPAIAQGEEAPQTTSSAPSVAAETTNATAAETTTAKSSTPSGDNTVKVATDRLDSLINMVGELVIAQSMVVQDTSSLVASNQRLGRNMAHLGKITRELQDLSMSLRMVPIDNVFRKMNRLVRDVARKMGKEVELILSGKDTELDRNVVEALNDPLVHMVRNCIDHGVEMPDERERVGKPRQGRVELKAYHQGGSINIEIIDDGKGLRKDKILKKAIDNGLVAADAQLTDQEIYQLIFAAGLSTADKVTDISGRGVGMDVVRQNMDRLRGRVDISSVEGKGTTFTIRLPLTLAVIDGLIVKVGTNKYVLPILSIEQSLRPKAEQISTVQNRGELCMVRGQLLPLLRLHRMFNVTPRTEDPTEALVVIVQDNDRRVCILVDELLGQEQVVIKSLGDGIDKVPGISGGAVLGDGNVSLILDVPGLIELATRHC
jgi:two-component system chemotaxis sensor kinase CheA